MNDYLYEIIDDYKHAKLIEEQDEIFNSFCSSIWSNKNKRRVYNRQVKFKVRNDLIDTEIGRIFNVWSEVSYIGYKAMSNDTDWCSLIRQKINNLYTRYFDKEVILNRDYMNLLKTPYNLYYRWIKGAEIKAEELTGNIEDAIYKASELKSIYQKQKMDLTWDEYKKVIEKFLKKAFFNCKLIEDYENENLTSKYIYNFTTEDNFYISYICKTLECEMLKWQKEYYKVRDHKKYKRCKECGALFEDKSKTRPIIYCQKCKNKHRNDTYTTYNKKRNKK